MVDYSCILSALCFFISNSIGIAIVVMDTNRSFFSLEDWKSLNPSFLLAEWQHRRNIAPLAQAASIFNAFAWFFLAVPMIQLSWALSRGGKRKIGVHAAIAALALAGCFTELISRLLVFGSFSAADWIASSFNLNYWLPDGITMGSADMIGWRSLEVTFIITEGLLLWVDAFEWIALFCILILLYFSVGTQTRENRKISMSWARMGLIIAFLTFIDFSADVLRLEEWETFSKLAVAVSIFNSVIMLPSWLLYLSCNLYKVMPQYNEAEDVWSPGS